MTKNETVKCKNCGANEFVQEAGTTRCLYCQTEYISFHFDPQSTDSNGFYLKKHEFENI